jgi:dienelactone hydrolase
MAEVLMFHHALGLTRGVRSFAEEIRASGHTVHTPDLYDGALFDDLDAGVANAERIGMDEIRARAQRAADALRPELVYIGFSLGVIAAQSLEQTRAGARGAVLCSSAIPLRYFGGTWPEAVPAQFHLMDRDPWDEGDLDVARSICAEHNEAELFVYPGDRHLFADESTPDYDAGAASLMKERVLKLLARA